MTYKYEDYLQTYIEGEVTKFVKGMRDNHPLELREMSKENLIYNLTDKATALTRQMIAHYIDAACYELLTMIRWAKQNPNERIHKGVGGK